MRAVNSSMNGLPGSRRGNTALIFRSPLYAVFGTLSPPQHSALLKRL
jgi:hypothetical protein